MLCERKGGFGSGHWHYTELQTVLMLKAPITVGMFVNLVSGGEDFFQ